MSKFLSPSEFLDGTTYHPFRSVSAAMVETFIFGGILAVFTLILAYQSSFGWIYAVLALFAVGLTMFYAVMCCLVVVRSRNYFLQEELEIARVVTFKRMQFMQLSGGAQVLQLFLNMSLLGNCLVIGFCSGIIIPNAVTPLVANSIALASFLLQCVIVYGSARLYSRMEAYELAKMFPADTHMGKAWRLAWREANV